MKGNCKMLNGKFEFIEKEHIYYYEGKQIPSVSKLLKPVSDSIYGDSEAYQRYIDAAKVFGHEIHRHIELFEKFNVTPDIEDEKMNHSFNEYLKIKNDPTLGFDVIATEKRKPIKLNGLIFGGTLDLKVKLRLSGQVALIDLKSSAEIHTKLVSLQNTFYSIEEDVDKIFVLQLPKDGKKKAKFVNLEFNHDMCNMLIDHYKIKTKYDKVSEKIEKYNNK